MATTWTISRRQATCAATGREFSDGERHASLLQVRDGALERVDLSLDAWQQRSDAAKQDPSLTPLFFWFTRHEVERKKTVQLDLESLDQLFVQLEGRPEQSVRELRYVLCLLLMRKRRAKVEKVLREGDEESFVVKRPRDEARYTVWVYDFEPERLEEVRAQLQAVFDGAEGPHGIRLGADDELDGDGDRDGGDARENPTVDPDSPESGSPIGGNVAPGADEGAPDPGSSDLPVA